MRKPSLTNEQTKEFKLLLDAGSTINQLVRHFGLSIATIKNYKKKLSGNPPIETTAEHLRVTKLPYDVLEKKYETLTKLYTDLVVEKEIKKYNDNSSGSRFRIDPYA